MFPYLPYLDTPAGRLTLGATVRSTRSTVQGIVTAIYQTAHELPGSSHRIEVAGRQSEPAAHFELVAPVPAELQQLLDQAQRAVTSGAFEVRLPQEGDRVYFADAAAQVIQLLGVKIGIHPSRVQDEIAYLERAAAAGKCDEIRLRGCFGIVGQLAYVSSIRSRPAPRFTIAQPVHFYNASAKAYIVSEVALFQDSYSSQHRQPGGEWRYYHSGDTERLHAYPEHVVTAVE